MIIERYIAAEILRPLVAIVGLLVLIFAGYSSGRYLTDAVNGLLPADALVRLVALKAVIALEVLLPVALYLSVVAGVGRLYADAEVTALRACGIGFARLLRVVLVVSLALALAVAALSLAARPWAYEQSYLVRARADAELVLARLDGGTFYRTGGGDVTVFAERVDDGGRLYQVFLRHDRDGVLQVVHAREAIERIDAAAGRRTLILTGAHAYRLRRDNTRDVIGHFGRLEVELPLAAPATLGYKRKAAATLELAASRNPADLAELQWRTSTPLSTVLLGLLGVAVSRAGGVRGRQAKLLVAVVVYAVYYNLGAMARTWVETGAVGPLPGIWWVPALLAVVVVGWLSEPLWSFRRARRRAAASLAGA